MSEFVVGKCRHCGEELRVPTRLKSFSCMFCGSKLTAEDLLEELPPAELDGDPAALLAGVKARIVHCVSDYPEINKQITRRDFEPAFEAYERGCRSVFEDLDLACRINPSRRDGMIDETAVSFLDQLEQYWTERKEWKAKHRQTLIRDDSKITIAVFLVPMVDRLNLSISRDFCQTLQRRWVERYPKSPFYVGSYEDISAGFKRRFRFCFITTAVCGELGKPDDCAELTAFRAFRDGYLAGCPDGPALIEEYYDIAPGIVACVNVCGDRSERWAEIRDRYLWPCYEDLQAGRPEACKARYVEMVRDLQNQYLS